MTDKIISLQPQFLAKKNSQELLLTLLNNPNLPVILNRMQPIALTKLIQKFGVEDSAEIIEFIKPHKLSAILDEEFWQAKKVGEPERFKRKQAVRWLRVWQELGEEYICATLMGLGATFTAALIIQFAKVHEFAQSAMDAVDFDSLAMQLDPYLGLKFRNFSLRSRCRDPEHWELIRNAMNALWECEADFLLETLALCCNRAAQDEWDDEGLDRNKIAEVEELLTDELSHDREERRKILGYIKPELARELLQGCRDGKGVAKLHEVIMQQFFLQKITNEEAYEKSENNEQYSAENNADSFEEEHNLSAEILEQTQNLEAFLFAELKPNYNMLALTEGEDKAEDFFTILQNAKIDSDTNAKIQTSILGLGNILLSGGNILGKKISPEDAPNAVKTLINLGFVYHEQRSVCSPTEKEVLELFQLGMKVLTEEVALPLAIILDDLVRSRSPEHLLLRQSWVDMGIKRGPKTMSFTLMVKNGNWYTLGELFAGIEVAISARIATEIKSLLAEFPVFPLGIIQDRPSFTTTKNWQFITNKHDISLINKYINTLPDIL